MPRPDSAEAHREARHAELRLVALFRRIQRQEAAEAMPKEPRRPE